MIGTAEWRIKWQDIIPVIDATFAVAKIKPEKSRHPFMGFYDTELTVWLAPRWLVCLTGRGAAQVSQSGSTACKESSSRIRVPCTKSELFFRLSFCNCISCIYNFDEVLHSISKHNSQQVLAFSRWQFEKVGLVFLVSLPFVFFPFLSVNPKNERF